ncbi:ATP-dependent Clp protease ATP-binding subunit [Patescibacteria group bacterium]|nr:ATP-dependent Clp protease ATP-binding subunit [Patescibacteria group bacterium]
MSDSPGANHFDKFSKSAKEVLVVAQEEAKRHKSSYVGTEHVLIGILSQPDSMGAQVLSSYGVSLENVYLVLKTVGRVVHQGSEKKDTGVSGDKKVNYGLSGFTKKLIEEAVKCAHEFKHSQIGTEHLLLALLMQKNTAATVILENMKINVDDVKRQIVKGLQEVEGQFGVGANIGMNGGQQNGQMMNPLEVFLSGLQGFIGPNDKEAPAYQKENKGKKSSTPALDYFTTDLVAEYKEKGGDPIIGRDDEIERMVCILSRKNKNNPVLIGEPGVGKTAVVEGLAQRIAKESVAEKMSDKRVLALSMTSVIAGTKYRGEFEERVKKIIEEASTQKDVILFIDEIHTIVGAGSAEGSLDAANILKPALSRSKVQIIGATTIKEYRKQIEKDAALERRLQPVLVEEPSEEDTISILRGIKETYENYHCINISDEAILESTRLSVRYLNDRFLPDKAIDVLDEAAALKCMKHSGVNDEVKKLQKDLSEIVKKKEDSVSKQDYEKAAGFRTDELKMLENIQQMKINKIPRDKWQTINEDDIGRVIAKMTGIPVNKISTNEIESLKGLEGTLQKYIIGQDEAIEKIATAIRRSRAGVSDENRPIASFMFLGPTGVGKTEVVKRLAQEIYNDRDALIKIDMSEFMERHNTSRLVGATAGYVGYEEGGQLTEQIRKKPYSIILFDEIEKAHNEVFNLLLQILEDGELTDAKGRKVNFKNAIIVMTSNIGAEKLNSKAAPIGFAVSHNELDKAERDYSSVKAEIMDELKNKFRPEFLNRLDKIVIFNALTHGNIKEIVKLQTEFLEKRLGHRGLKIILTPSALEILVKKSYEPEYGARPVRRKIQDFIEDPLTDLIIDSKIKDNDTVKIVKKGVDGLKLEVQKK